MQERSEEQVISRLLELENDGQAERRAQLSGERFLSLLNDPDTGRSYILRHGTDETEGAEIPPATATNEHPPGALPAPASEHLPSAAPPTGPPRQDASTRASGDWRPRGGTQRDRGP